MRSLAVLALAAPAAIVSACGATSSPADDAALSSAQAGHPSRQHEHVYKESSGSMEPTLAAGARVIVSAGQPRVGAIVVFHPPVEAEHELCGPVAHHVDAGGAACAEPLRGESRVRYLKRIVAGPRDELFIKEGHVSRRAAGSSGFAREPEPYIRPCEAGADCSFPTPIQVPAGHWYLLGDNRGESDDSRYWGAIPTSWIVGIVTACAAHFAPAKSFAERISARACRLQSAHR